jgi:7-carboxy-7-deazaguanine synthase
MEGCIKPSYQLKFVYSGEDSVKEIKEILSKLPYVNEENVMLMPEGTTNDQLSKISQECADVCIREGWQFCDRLHIRIWGDKRGV